jgi:arylformamidase
MPSQDPAWLDSMYNNRALVPDHPAYLQRWAADSAAAREVPACRIDLRYGDGDSETLDVFPAAGNAPVLVFVHGGYWRSLDKSDHSFIAPAFNREGACVVVPNYALCPGSAERPVSVGDILAQMVEALAWTWRHAAGFGGDPARITVAGHSAGGQLAAMLLAVDWPAVAPDLPAGLVRNALSISGVHDLRPLQHAPFIADALRLGDAEAARLSPFLQPAPTRGVLHAVAGGAESAEFQRQNGLMQAAWGSDRVPVSELQPGLNHFGVVDALADPAQRVHQLALQLLLATAT